MSSSILVTIACPAESPLFTKDMICDIEEVYPTPCTFEYSTTQSNGICTNKDDCICMDGKWACYPSTSCITTDTSNDVDTCPELSPLLNEIDTICDEEGQLCTYTNDSIFPGGISNVRGDCTCTSGKWVCEATSNSGTSTVVCPAESPLVTKNMICNQEYGDFPIPCTFEYKTSLPDGICTNKDECLCKSGTWDCYFAVGCVSN